MSNLIRLSRLTGDSELARRADSVAAAFARDLEAAPVAHCHLAAALQTAAAPSLEVVIAGDPSDEATRRLLDVVRAPYLPDAAVLLVPDGEAGRTIRRLAPFTEHHAPIGGEPAAYLCRNFSCQQPTTDPQRLAAAQRIRGQCETRHPPTLGLNPTSIRAGAIVPPIDSHAARSVSSPRPCGWRSTPGCFSAAWPAPRAVYSPT
jgi:hypothetical protein